MTRMRSSDDGVSSESKMISHKLLAMMISEPAFLLSPDELSLLSNHEVFEKFGASYILLP